MTAYLLDHTHVSEEEANHNRHETVNSATRGITYVENSVHHRSMTGKYLKVLFNVTSVNLVMGVTQKLFKAVAAA
jgi:hypothetical protein